MDPLNGDKLPRGPRRGAGKRRLGTWLLFGAAIFVLLGVILPRTTTKRIVFRTFPWERSTRDCAMEMSSLAAALRAYKGDRGSLPSTLVDLVPKHLSEFPRCPADFVPDRPSYLYRASDGRGQPAPLVVCERHWEAGLDIIISGDIQPQAVWKTDRWMPGERIGLPHREFEECERSLVQIAGALRKYREERGALPQNLSEMVPNCVQEVPTCPADFREARWSYLYWRLPGAGPDAPLLTCERHWQTGLDLYVVNCLEVRTSQKHGLKAATSLTKQDVQQVEWERDALMHGSLPYALHWREAQETP